MHSCIYEGTVRHRRFAPIENAFQYPLFFFYLDLDELDTVFADRWFFGVNSLNLGVFRRRDHLFPSELPFKEAIGTFIEEKAGLRPEGPIRMLTHLAYFGYCFNPVSFYYCFSADEKSVDVILAEVNNTPWGERHFYFLTKKDNLANEPRKRYRFAKAFHVSPFFDMDLDYDWRFNLPQSSLNTHFILERKGERVFDATLRTKRVELDEVNLPLYLLRYPFLTLRVMFLIHWQAVRLWYKGATFYRHPKKRKKSD